MLNLEEVFKTHKTLYLYGKTKSGKTSSILNYMKNNQKDYSYHNIQDIKNEEHFLSLLECQNIYHMFLKKKDSQGHCKSPEKYIIVDNIDYLQNSDKKIINVFIKFLKKQKHNQYPHVSFIFIGSNIKDKKVIELMEYTSLQHEYIPLKHIDYDKNIKEIVACFLSNGHYEIEGLCDKNIIALCFHENVIQILDNNLPLYERFLYNFCNGDYYDRISFKKQLWQFNEISFYLKVVYNSFLCKQCVVSTPILGNEIEFTKILTKFSNEYSNQNFIIHMCEKLKCQKEELYELMLSENDKWDQFTKQEQKRITKLLLQL